MSQKFDEDIKLIRWLETNPEYKTMVRNAKGKVRQLKSPDNFFYNSQQFFMPLIMLIYGLIFATPRDFDGQTSAPESLKRDSNIVAGIVSGATLINAITNWPILYYAFKSFNLFYFAYLAPAIINLILLYWTNKSGTAVANAKRGKKVWFSAIGGTFFLLISMVQSLVAGIGSELINNRDELSYKLAREKIEEQSKLVNLTPQRHPKFQQYNEADRMCKDNQKKLENLPDGHWQRDSLYSETFGAY